MPSTDQEQGLEGFSIGETPSAQPPRLAGAFSREGTPIILVGQIGFIIPSVIQLGIGKMEDDDEGDMTDWIWGEIQSDT